MADDGKNMVQCLSSQMAMLASEQPQTHQSHLQLHRTWLASQYWTVHKSTENTATFPPPVSCILHPYNGYLISGAASQEMDLQSLAIMHSSPDVNSHIMQ